MEFSFLSRFLTTGQWQIHVKSKGSLELGLSPNIYVMVSFIHWTWTWVIKLFFLSLVCFPCFGHIWYIWREDLYSLSWYHFGGLSSTWNASHTYPLSCSLGLSYMKALLEASPAAPTSVITLLLWASMTHVVCFYINFLLDCQFFKHKGCYLLFPMPCPSWQN